MVIFHSYVSLPEGNIGILMDLGINSIVRLWNKKPLSWFLEHGFSPWTNGNKTGYPSRQSWLQSETQRNKGVSEHVQKSYRSGLSFLSILLDSNPIIYIYMFQIPLYPHWISPLVITIWLPNIAMGKSPFLGSVNHLLSSFIIYFD